MIGRRLMVNGDGYEVIGVLPPSFEFLDGKISVLMPFRLNRSEVLLIGSATA